MRDLTPARIDAALKLAEAVDGYMGGDAAWAFSTQVGEAVKAYRASLPKLRTRAEVDAEIAKGVRYFATNSVNRKTTLTKEGIGSSDAAYLERLCAESTAPEPRLTFSERVAELLGMSDGDNGGYVYASEEEVMRELRQLKERANYFNPAEPTAPEPEANPDERPCGCEETEALKDKLGECLRLLKYAHQRASEIAQALAEGP